MAGRLLLSSFCVVAILLLHCSALLPPPPVSRVCVDNNAGFDLHWALKDLNTNIVGPDSGSYPIDQTRCQAIDTVAGVLSNHLIQTTVYADGGVSHDTDSAVFYSPNSTNTATFTCTGTTLDYSCSLN